MSLAFKSFASREIRHIDLLRSMRFHVESHVEFESTGNHVHMSSASARTNRTTSCRLLLLARHLANARLARQGNNTRNTRSGAGELVDVDTLREKPCRSLEQLVLHRSKATQFHQCFRYRRW